MLESKIFFCIFFGKQSTKAEIKDKAKTLSTKNRREDLGMLKVVLMLKCSTLDYIHKHNLYIIILTLLL